MKRKLIPITYETHGKIVGGEKKGKGIIGGKRVIEIGGNMYCEKCGNKLLIEINRKGKGPEVSSQFYIDISCFCDAF